MAQPATGVYRLVANRGTDRVMAENYETKQVVCVAKGAIPTEADLLNHANQLWEYTLSADGSTCTLRNVYTGRYIQPQSASSETFLTGDATNNIAITEASTSGMWMLSSGSYLHCDASFYVVNWWDANSEASFWTFEAVDITTDQIDAARADYQAYLAMNQNQADYTTRLLTYFTDEACTELNATYAAYTDDALRLALAADGIPAGVQDIAVKVKNNTWATREKEFRIHSYEPYADPVTWRSKLKTYSYTYMNNPTGINAALGDMLYVFVGGDVPENATLYLAGQYGFNPITSGTMGMALKKGFNAMRVPDDGASLFVLYTVDTGDQTRKVADYPNLTIHIEGGTVNGYWDKNRHTDTDYQEMLAATSSDYFFIKGDRHILHVSSANMKTLMPNAITACINWWDEMTRWEQELMGICKDVADGKREAAPDNLTGGEDFYPTYFNGHMLARCGEGLSGLYATEFLTNYYGGAENLILNYSPDNSDFDAWAPAHECGHVHQGAINMAGTSETTNNLFSNVVLYRTGKQMSRGEKLAQVLADFEAGKSWYLRSDFERMRMFWQLYLYYHVAGHNKAFYPTLFKLLRETPLQRVSTVDAATESLRFVEKCCEAAGEDLTDFFTAWGFFVPVENLVLDDYGTFTVTATPEAIAATKATISSYPVKNSAILLIEDRIEATERTDGVEGNKLTYDVAVGEAGALGQYTEFAVGATATTGSYVSAQTGTTLTMQGTGGVGFLVYDADGNLAAFSNSYSFELPLDLAESGNYNVVVIDADGTTGTVETVADAGTDEQKLYQLQQALQQADVYLSLIDESGMRVGFYPSDALATLQVLAEKARNAIDNGQTDRYVDLTADLSAELIVLERAEGLMISLQKGAYYTLTNANYGHNSYVDSDGTVKNNGGTVTDDYKWEFVSSGTDGLYYLRNVGQSTYAGSVTISNPVQATATTADESCLYSVTSRGDGSFLLKSKNGNDYSYMHEAANYKTVGWEQSATASHWYITRVGQTDLSDAYAQLDEMMTLTQVEVDRAMASMKTLQCTDASADYYIWSNAAHNDLNPSYLEPEPNGVVSALLDNNTATYYHSSWWANPGEYHYLAVDLGEGNGLDKFAFSYTTRSNNTHAPQTLVVEGSNNGTDYTEITTLTSTDETNPLPTAGGVDYTSDVISSITAYRYLRFKVTKTDGTNGNYYFFALSEFALLSGQTVVANKAAAALSEARSVYDNATTETELINAYDGLKPKYQALLEVNNDELLAQLNELIATMTTMKTERVASYTWPVTPTLQCTEASADYYISSNADHNALNSGTDGQGLAGLLDGNIDTYFHSAYYNSPDAYHYLQVDLGEGNAWDSFTFNYTTRNKAASNWYPSEIVVSGSTDGTTFTDITTLRSTDSGNPLPTASGTEYVSAPISGGTAYRYLRFTVTKSPKSVNTNYYFFVMAEFGLSRCGTVTHTDAYSGLSTQASLAALSALEKAETAVSAKASTTALKSAYNNLLSAYYGWMAETPVYTLTLSTVKYATLFLDSPVKIPEGLSAYTCALDGNTVVLTAVKTVIPAETGVVIYGDTPGSYPLYLSRTAGSVDGLPNQMIGFVTNTEVTESGTRYYALSYEGDKAAPTRVGFYRPATYNGGTFTAKANRAYLEVPGETSVKAFYLMGGEATEVVSPKADTFRTDEIYDLSGRRLPSLPSAPGLYIVNGKKVVITATNR